MGLVLFLINSYSIFIIDHSSKLFNRKLKNLTLQMIDQSAKQQLFQVPAQQPESIQINNAEVINYIRKKCNLTA